MGNIRQLDPHVADMIAAGEVVERPASVVKELLENAIDAGATVITVEIMNGGTTYIRVSDNGCGIAPEDCTTAFLRHATSKLHTAAELEAIGTLGFRGEALAAISAVSRIDLLTRETGASAGASLSVEGGAVTSEEQAGCPEGTTIIVRDLFFNTPARQKFAKSDRAEGATVTSAVINIALSHPEVSLRYIKDGQEEFHTPGDNRAESAVYSLLGREFSKGLLPVSAGDGQLQLRGFISAPDSAKGNRSAQYFFVNGRCVKSVTLRAALEQAYKNTLFTGRFPCCVLYLKLNPVSIDVNVHPAKTEIKFLYEKQVFDTVYYAVLSALTSEQSAPAMVGFTNPEGSRAHPIERNPAADIAASANYTPHDTDKRGFEEGFKQEKLKEYAPAYNNASATDGNGSSRGDRPRSPVHTPTVTYLHEPADSPAYRIIGEAYKTYIIAETGSGIRLIDKHAVHERLNFDRLKAETGTYMSETLLTPVIIRPGAEDAQLLLENAQLLAEMGIEIGSLGGDAIAIRALPSIVRQDSAQNLLGEICEDIRAGGAMESGAELRDKILRTVACKAAIKAGWDTENEEFQYIAEKVFSGEVTHCPHGRPVYVDLPKNSIERDFKR